MKNGTSPCQATPQQNPASPYKINPCWGQTGTLWSLDDFRKMADFRNQFSNLYPEARDKDSIAVLRLVMDKCNIRWDPNGKTLHAEIPAFIAERPVQIVKPNPTEPRYILFTDLYYFAKKGDPPEKIFGLLGMMIHEIAHVVLAHTPAHASLDLPEDGDLGIFSRLLNNTVAVNNNSVEHAAELLRAVLTFWPLEDFREDMLRARLSLRSLSERYHSPVDMCARFVHLIFIRQAHFLRFDVFEHKFEVKYVPYDYPEELKDALENEDWLCDKKTALASCLAEHTDIVQVTPVSATSSFHCKAFYIGGEFPKIVVLGLNNYEYEVLAPLWPNQETANLSCQSS